MSITCCEGVCSRSYPVGNSRASYCHLWLDCVIPRYLTNGVILGKKVIEHKMCVLVSPTTFVSDISQSQN